MNPYIIQILLSAGLGALIGFDREKLSNKRSEFNFAGIRTSSLISVLGLLIYKIEDVFPYFGLAILVSFLIALVGSFISNVYRNLEKGATSEVAIIITLIVGFLNGHQMYLESVVLTLLTVLILSYKQSIHLFVERVSKRDFKFGILFFIFAFVILPLISDQNYGYYGFFNPREVWLMVTLITGLSFVSYILERIFANKNMLYLTSFLGGLISSTATTLNLSVHINKNPKKISNAIIFTSLAMFVRVLIEISVVNINLALETLIFVILLSIMSLFMVLLKKDEKSTSKTKIKAYEKPFELKQALSFATFFALIKLLIAFLNENLGDAGVYLSSFISGFIDTDAVSLALAATAGNEISMNVAKGGVILALIANTIMKLNMTFIKSHKQNYKKVLNFTVLTVVIGFASFYLPLK